MKQEIEEIFRSKLAQHEEPVPAAMWSQIADEIPTQRHANLRLWSRLAIAAAAGVVGVIATLSLLDKQIDHRMVTAQQETILPSEPTAVAKLPVQKAPFQPLAEAIDSVSSQPKPASTQVNETPAAKAQEPQQTLLCEAKEIDEPTHYPQENPSLSEVATPPTPVSNEVPTRSHQENIELTRQMNAAAYLPAKRKNTPTTRIGLIASNSVGMTTTGQMQLRSSLIPGLSTSSLYEQLSVIPLKFVHQTPFSVGANVSVALTSKLYLESGLAFTLLGSTYSNAVREGMQELYYLGIPLNVGYVFWQNSHLSVYGLVGAQMDINLGGRRREKIEDEYRVVSTFEEIREKQPQFTLALQAGIEYNFSRLFSIYLQPGMGYSFDNGSSIDNIWKQKPLHFSLQVGVRAKL